MGLTYKESGVDIAKGERFISIIREKLKSNEQENIGLFGGFFDLGSLKYKHPILVASTDGVGTKLILAREAGRYSTIGIDLVAMCVNDVVCTGSKPLFFLDYLATSELSLKEAEAVIEGIIKGCKLAGCTLIGGETAEMPGVYKKGDYELAGFACGVVEKDNIVNPKRIEEGDILLGVGAGGIHSNGLSLARKALFVKGGYDFYFKHPFLPHDLITELLLPTRIYVNAVLEIVKREKIKGIAHITGGGIYSNLKRLLNEGLDIKIFWNDLKQDLKKDLKPHPIFKIIQDAGDIEEKEMRRTFNMGIGLVLVISAEQKAKILSLLKKSGENAMIIGEVISS
jgi:phosphoribosylformylglycinamidine cyclo-ligase